MFWLIVNLAHVRRAVLNQSSVESLKYDRYYHGYYAEKKGQQTAA